MRDLDRGGSRSGFRGGGMWRPSLVRLLLLLGLELVVLRGNAVHAADNGGKVAGAYSPHKDDSQALINNSAAFTINSFTTDSSSSSSFLTFDALSFPTQASYLADQLVRLIPGIDINAVDETADLVSCRVPADRVGELNGGDAAMRLDVLREAVRGLDGRGVKVGVVSNSFNRYDPDYYDGVGTTARQDYRSGDLPREGVTVLKDAKKEYLWSDEGRAMLQIVHDLAPKASLYFHTGVGGQAMLTRAFDRLTAAGCNVIVDDIKYYFEAFYEEGPVAQAAGRAFANGTACFTAAGNDDRQAWETTLWQEDRDGFYVFDDGRNYQTFSIAAGDEVAFVFQWDEPFTNCQIDLDIFLSQDGHTKPVALDTANNIGGQPVASMSIGNSGTSDTTYRLKIQRVRSEGERRYPGRVKYVFVSGLGTSGPTSDLSHAFASSITGHENSPVEFTVGAAYYKQTPAFGTGVALRQAYSSAGGGTPLLFNADGARLSTPIIPKKPDACAPDGVDTTFFGSRDEDNSGYPDFFGTSAAAPHAGGLAALLLQVRPAFAPAALYDLMRRTADDMDDERTPDFDYGYDNATGYGFLNGRSAYTSARCHSTCGSKVLVYPFHLDRGCGPSSSSSSFRLVCRRTASGGTLKLATPSGLYRIEAFGPNYLLLADVNGQLAAYGCGGSSVGKVSFTSYGADGRLLKSASCVSSVSSSTPSYVNGTQGGCSVPLSYPTTRVLYSSSTSSPSSCGGANILYPPAVRDSLITPANTASNYFVRVDYVFDNIPPRPFASQACGREFWDEYLCRWPEGVEGMLPTTPVRDAMARAGENNDGDRAAVDRKFSRTFTLLQAVSRRPPTGNVAFYNLAGEAAAALLNAYQVRYNGYPDDVRALFIAALASGADVADATARFSALNNGGFCPLTPCQGDERR
eukprot:jgi/Chlat1/7724/Chrsp66S00566